MSGPGILCLLLSRGDQEALERCLRAVNQSQGVACRVVVIGPGATAGGNGIMAAHGATWLPAAAGLGETVEAARSGAGEELLALLDERVVVGPRYFIELAALLRAQERAGAVAGVLRRSDGREAPVAVSRPAWLRAGPAIDSRPLQEVAWLPGQAVLVRAAAIDELGAPFLDPVLGAGAAQLDFFLRCLRNGWQLWRLAAAEACWDGPALQLRGPDQVLLAFRHLSDGELGRVLAGWLLGIRAFDFDDGRGARRRRELLGWSWRHAGLLWQQRRSHRRLAHLGSYREALHSFEERVTYPSHARPEVMALVPARARRVVDVGCGAGALGQALKRSRPNIEVRGVELSPSWAERAGQVLDGAVQGRAEDGLPAGWPEPDCLIFADVLEHLIDPWTTLRRWRAALQPGGTVIVSVPNVLHRSVITGLLRARWDYEDAGILDRTHLRFFTRRSAVALLEQAGLRVRRLERSMGSEPLGRGGLLLLWGRRRQEQRGRRLTSADPLALLFDLFTRQFLLVGQWGSELSRTTTADPFTVSVVIVNWNAREDVIECIRSVRQQVVPPQEIVLVDNGSTDGSTEMVRKLFPEVKLVEAGRNLGFAEGCNVGLQACTGSWVALLNNDAIADPRWLAELIAAARAGGPRVGSLQSRVLFRQKRTHTNSTGILIFRNGCARDRDFDEPSRGGDVVEEIFGPTAAAALYRRAMLEEVKLPSGYFDRGFFMYMEDADLSWRCRLAGWQSLYVPSSVVHHAYQGSSSRRGNHFVVTQCRKNRLRMLIKNASPSFLITTMGTSLFDLARVSYTGGPKAALDLLSGAVDAVRQRPAQNRMVLVERRELERQWVRSTR